MQHGVNWRPFPSLFLIAPLHEGSKRGDPTATFRHERTGKGKKGLSVLTHSFIRSRAKLPEEDLSDGSYSLRPELEEAVKRARRGQAGQGKEAHDLATACEKLDDARLTRAEEGIWDLDDLPILNPRAADSLNLLACPCCGRQVSKAHFLRHVKERCPSSKGTKPAGKRDRAPVPLPASGHPGLFRGVKRRRRSYRPYKRNAIFSANRTRLPAPIDHLVESNPPQPSQSSRSPSRTLIQQPAANAEGQRKKPKVQQSAEPQPDASIPKQQTNQPAQRMLQSFPVGRFDCKRRRAEQFTGERGNLILSSLGAFLQPWHPCLCRYFDGHVRLCHEAQQWQAMTHS